MGMEDNPICEYLVVYGEGGHLHGHGHDVNSTVDEAGFKFLIEVRKLLRSARETETETEREEREREGRERIKKTQTNVTSWSCETGCDVMIPVGVSAAHLGGLRLCAPLYRYTRLQK